MSVFCYIDMQGVGGDGNCDLANGTGSVIDVNASAILFNPELISI